MLTRGYVRAFWFGGVRWFRVFVCVCVCVRVDALWDSSPNLLRLPYVNDF